MYRSSEQIEWESSPRYNALVYRKPETAAKEEEIELFIDFITDDSETEPTAEETQKLRAGLREYLQYTPEKAKAGELELLEHWRKACAPC